MSRQRQSFFDKLMKSLLKDNVVKAYSIHNEGKPIDC